MEQPKTNIEIINQKFQDLLKVFNTNAELQMKKDEVIETKMQELEKLLNEKEKEIQNKEKEIEKLNSMIADKDKELKRKECDLNFMLRDRNHEIFKNTSLQRQKEFIRKNAEYVKSERDFYFMQLSTITEEYERYKIETNEHYDDFYGYVDSLHDTLQLHGLFEESQLRYYNYGGYRQPSDQETVEENELNENQQIFDSYDNDGDLNEEKIVNSSIEKIKKDQNEADVSDDNVEASKEKLSVFSNEEQVIVSNTEELIKEDEEIAQLTKIPMTPYQRAIEDLVNNKRKLPEYGHLKYMVPFYSEIPYRHTLEPLVEFIEEEEHEAKFYPEFIDDKCLNYENETDEEFNVFLHSESQIDNQYEAPGEFQFMVESDIDCDNFQLKSKVESQTSLYSFESSEKFLPQSTSTQENLNSKNQVSSQTDFNSELSFGEFDSFQITDLNSVNNPVFQFSEFSICDIDFMQPSMILESEKMIHKNRPKKRAQRKINKQKERSKSADDKKIKRSSTFSKLYSFGV